MTAPVRFPRFFVTSPAPCPYLGGRTERKVFTELNGPHAEQLNDALSRIGFRRSQNVAYRPSCVGCRACVSVRVAAGHFAPSASQKRVMKRNGDLLVSECRPLATQEQFDLLQRYLAHRHPGGGMALMGEADFADMVEHTGVSSYVIEYREPALEDVRADGSGGGSRAGRLVAACLTDRQGDGLSMIYSFYEPDHEDRSGLGNFVILDHIRRARELGLPYVYLGYWVEGSQSMQYKIRFRPLELLGPEGWCEIRPDEQARLISQVAAGVGSAGPVASGASKDGSAASQWAGSCPAPIASARIKPPLA